MTEQWWSDIYRKSAEDISEARMKRLLDEFKYLGTTLREKAHQTYNTPDGPAVRNEKAGTD